MTEPKSRRESERALKVDLPAALKTQLKLEAVELDVRMRDYVQQILEDRLPWEVRQQVTKRAESAGMNYRDFLLKVLRDAGVIS